MKKYIKLTEKNDNREINKKMISEVKNTALEKEEFEKAFDMGKKL